MCFSGSHGKKESQRAPGLTACPCCWCCVRNLLLAGCSAVHEANSRPVNSVPVAASIHLHAAHCPPRLDALPFAASLLHAVVVQALAPPALGRCLSTGSAVGRLGRLSRQPSAAAAAAAAAWRKHATGRRPPDALLRESGSPRPPRT